jgi:hypothetical protein
MPTKHLAVNKLIHANAFFTAVFACDGFAPEKLEERLDVHIRLVRDCRRISS